MEPLTENLSRHLARLEVPRSVYAAIGAATALRQDGPDELRHRTAAAWADVQQLPVDIAAGALAGVQSAATTAGDAAGAIGAAVSRMGSGVAATYNTLAERGHDEAVAFAAERAVRARVSRVEDRVAPKAGRAAVRFLERRRRLQESPAVRRTASAAQRTRFAARRGAERFSQMNAPVMAADPDDIG